MKYMRFLFIMVLILGFASGASAVVTINDPWPAGNLVGGPTEVDLYNIYNFVFGTSLSPSSSLPQVTPTFTTGSWTVIETFRYAGNQQALGYDNGGGFTPLIGAIPSTIGTLPTIQNKTFLISGPFAWEDQTNGNIWSSDVGKNFPTTTDVHFVAFTDAGHPGEFLIAFEDLPFIVSDKDYNDLVVLVTNKVPEPTTLLLFGAGLVGFGLMRRRFKK